MQQHRRHVVGIDLGGTKIAGVLLGEDGTTAARTQLDTRPDEGASAVIGRMAAAVNQLTAHHSVAGIGIGSPGQVDAERGVVYNATNLGWQEVDVAGALQPLLNRPAPIWLQKDANAEALGEYIFGAARDCPDFVYLGIGTGLGCGVVANHTLIVGQTWVAGELGHLVLDPEGVPCACGNRGCAETVVSGRGLVNLARRHLAEGGYATQLPRGEQLTAAAIVQAARTGDPLALAVLSQCAEWLGILLAHCVALLNPARIVIGGGLGRQAFDLLLPRASYEIERRTLAACHAKLDMVTSGIPSSAVGAACIAWQELRNLGTGRSVPRSSSS